MLKGLFGGKKEEKKTQPTQAQIAKSERDQEFSNQEKLVSIKKATEEARGNVENFYAKLTKKENQIKELLKQNKREEARRQLALFKTMKDQIVTLESLCTTLEKELIKLEVNMQSVNLVKALQTANDLQKGQEKLRDNLENVLMDLKEQQAQENEIKNLVQELAQGDADENEDIDNMLNQFEQEVMDEKMTKISDMPVKNNLPQQQYQPSMNVNMQYSAATNTNSVKSQQYDDLDDLLEKTSQMN